ncbi:coiled-coil domain-containing protein 24 [Pelobates fuscus]|uniref:coiled-coil domain-containing protein 24 n=1 Tax=Pelobates fuscus TaxID=191477 RepID=UPI002FE4C811
MLQPISDQDSGYGEIIEPPTSLWKLVEEQVPVSERAEIKRILGDAAVDLSLELNAEVELLLDLLRDLRATYSSSRQSSPHSLTSLLADPPVIKDMITQEIRMLLLSVRQKARCDGLDEAQVLSKYNPKVVGYVMAEIRPESRVSSRCSGSLWSHDVRRSSCLSSSYYEMSRPQTRATGTEDRPLSSLSSGSSIEDDLEELKDKLKISHIDEVVMHLKSLLEEECKARERDIALLQQRLELEYLYGADSQTPLPEPSLAELKEERRVIERDLQLRDSATSSPQSMNPKIRKTRSMEVSDRTISDHNPVCLSHIRPASGSLQDKAPKIAPCPPHSKIKIEVKQKPSSSKVLIQSTAAPYKQEERTDITAYKLSHRHIKAHPVGVIQVSCPSHDFQKCTVPVLNALSVKNSSSTPILLEQSPSTPKLQVPLQGMDCVFVPSPPQVQRPAGTTSSFSSLRRTRTQNSITPS